MRLTWSAHSEIGLVRKDNQDSGYASDHLLVVADGMGGAARGDLASAVAIDAFTRLDQSVTGDDMLPALQGVIDAANEKIADLVADDPRLEGMGTTVCGAMFDGEQFGIVHVGDSRGYLLRDGDLSRITHDHSWVQSLIDDGRLSPDEALYHPHRNLLLKVLNGQPNNTPDLDVHDARPGDRILFCSDGLCGLVEDDEIYELLRNPDRNEALRDLIAAAHDAGGVDNITILIGDIDADDDTAAQPVVLGAAANVDIPDVPHVPRFTGSDLTDTTSAERVDEPGSHDLNATDVATVIPAAAPVGAVLDPEDARYTPRPRPRRRLLLWSIVALLALALLATAGLIGYDAIRSRYYVGAQADSVAIFRGSPDQIGPFHINELAERTAVHVSDLPPRYQEDVRSHRYQNQSLDSARTTVANLTERATACQAAREARARATSTPTPSPSPTPTASPSDTPSAPPTGSPGASPTPSPTVTPSVTPTEIPTPPAAPDEC